MVDQLFGRGFGFIVLTVYLSLMLQVLPMGEWLAYLRPVWPLMVVLFWAQVIPARFGLGAAFVVGILLDVLLDTILGMHALVLVIMVFLQLFILRQVKVFSTVQQIILILAFSFVFLLLLRLLNGFFVERLEVGLAYWLPAIVNALLWPWFFVVMDGLKTRFGIYESNQ